MSEKKAEKLHRLSTSKIILLISICCFCALSGIAVGVYAWYSAQSSKNVDGNYGKFEVTATVKFGATPAVIGGGVYPINVSDKSSPTFIDKLNIDIGYRGAGKYYLRVMMLEQWEILTNGTWTIARQPVTKYNLDGATWFDNRKMDNYFYYPLILESNSDTYTNIKLVTGKTTDIAYADMQMKLFLKVEAVQYNRADEKWGFSNADGTTCFPWETVAPPAKSNTNSVVNADTKSNTNSLTNSLVIADKFLPAKKANNSIGGEKICDKAL